MAVDGDDENELSILEFIHSLVETMDKYFESVCELDVSMPIYHSLIKFILYFGNLFFFRLCFTSTKLITLWMRWWQMEV